MADEQDPPQQITIEQAIAAVQGLGGLPAEYGMEFDIIADEVVCRMDIQQKHIGGPGTAHGGAVSALLDTAFGATALMSALPRGQMTSTVELKVNFLRPALLGQRLFTSTTLQSIGRTLLVVSGHALCEETQKKVAFAVGTFNLYPIASMRRE